MLPPLIHASAKSPPALLLAGADDDLVDPQRNTEQLTRALQAQDVSVQSEVLANLGHIKILLTLAAPFQHWAPVIEQVTRFVSAQAGEGFSPPSSSACSVSSR